MEERIELCGLRPLEVKGPVLERKEEGRKGLQESVRPLGSVRTDTVV